MSEKQFFRLAHAEARRRASLACQTAPDGGGCMSGNTLTIRINKRASICAHSLLSKKGQKQPQHGKISEPAKQWNAMQALTNQTVKESFHG